MHQCSPPLLAPGPFQILFQLKSRTTQKFWVLASAAHLKLINPCYTATHLSLGKGSGREWFVLELDKMSFCFVYVPTDLQLQDGVIVAENGTIIY